MGVISMGAFLQLTFVVCTANPVHKNCLCQGGTEENAKLAMSESPEVCQFSSTEAISQHCYNVSASN